MSTAIHHAMSSAKKHGGEPEEYLHIHEWFDQYKAHGWNFAHRMILHHTGGIELCEQVFGPMLEISTGKQIPIRWIGEQHMREDFGFVPTPGDWMEAILGTKDGQPPGPRSWMLRGAKTAEQLGVAQ